METILVHAQTLVYTLVGLMPTAYQRDSLQTLLGLFLQAQGHPLPQSSSIKSASALSRFLNHYDWPTRHLIRVLRQQILQQLLAYRPQGRRPYLQVIIDLTTLEKRGKFKAFEHLIHVLQGKRGLHLVVLYLVVGSFRVPFAFRVWRGKGDSSPAHLALRLIDNLPRTLTRAYRVLVLADAAFGSTEFLHGLRKRRLHGIVGVRCDRRLSDGRRVDSLCHKGQQVTLDGLSFPVTISWLYIERNEKLEKRFVLSTRPLKGNTITWWGRRRWAIEGFFKTIKHRFGLHRFGQQSLVGAYRWFVLCLVSFLLAHWCFLSQASCGLPDWGASAQKAIQTLFPEVAICLVLVQLERIRSLLHSFGLEVILADVRT